MYLCQGHETWRSLIWLLVEPLRSLDGCTRGFVCMKGWIMLHAIVGRPYVNWTYRSNHRSSFQGKTREGTDVRQSGSRTSGLKPCPQQASLYYWENSWEILRKARAKVGIILLHMWLKRRWNPKQGSFLLSVALLGKTGGSGVIHLCVVRCVCHGKQWECLSAPLSRGHRDWPSECSIIVAFLPDESYF